MTWYPFPNVPVIAAAKLKLYAWIALGILVLLLAVGITAWLAGKQDQKDAQASKDVAALKTAMNQAITDLKEQRTAFAEAMEKNAQAQARMSAIAERTELQQQAQEKLSYELKTNLERALLARPDLAVVRVGDDILCNWNRAATGTDTGRNTVANASTTVPGCKPAAAVPSAATGERRRTANPAKSAATNKQAGQPVPKQPPRPD